MQYQFTPAARRALRCAAGWSGPDACDEFGPPALLLGLLAEPECRAAVILARYDIDTESVRRQWPELTERAESGWDDSADEKNLSADVKLSLQAACQQAACCQQPPELATEHLLLGLISADHEVSTWLRRQGVDPEALEAEIRQIYGVEAAPLPFNAEDEPLDGPQEDDVAEDADGPGAPLRFAPATRGFAAATRDVAPIAPGETISLHEHVGALRVLDAAANRAREGLRSVEDYVRFILDDRHLTGLCKQIRHDLAAVLECIPGEHRLAARETQADVGTVLATTSEHRRETSAGVLTANLTRLQEALRSLEEFGKLLSPDMAAELKQLRYRSYTLQRAVEITRTSIERLDRARLYVLIDGRPSPEEFRQLAETLIDAGVHVLQLRDKQLDDRRLLGRARLLRELTADTETLFIMNDRPDVAALSRADGVHVGQEEVSVKDARTIVGPDALIGVSTHSIEQARQAVLDGANYIGVGPTFPSDTKHFDEFPGLDLLGAVAAEIRLPAFVIGGITPENLPEVLSAGFARIAISGAVSTAAEPAAVVREMLAMLAGTNVE